MIILTLNCGSSSVKYQVFDWAAMDALAVGVVEKVTIPGSFIKHKVKGRDEIKLERDCPSHTDAVALIMRLLTEGDGAVIADMSVIKAVGHRVVHGGTRFTKSVIVDDAVMAAFREVQDLAPLHVPANIIGIEAAKKVLPNAPHCAIMDTAWHQTMPPESYVYALPYEWLEKYQARRYGFHGTSFLYTAKRAAALLGRDPFKTNLIICHIGNGASVCAVKDGLSYDTSMGLTPLEGLVMGTRSGDVDPALPFYIMRKSGMSADEIDAALNKKSGVLGITGRFSDRRDVEEAAAAGDELCELAQTIEARRVKKYIGAYMAALGRVDAIVMTAGVGEFAPGMRARILEGLDGLGVSCDPERNALARTRNAELLISSAASKIPVFVIPTDEELVMTEDTYALVNGTYDVHTKFAYSFQSKDYVNKARAEGLEADIAKKPALAGIVARPK